MVSNFSALRTARSRSRSRAGMVSLARVSWDRCRVVTWESASDADSAAEVAVDAASEALSAARSSFSSK